ncbi:hypothetical protein A9179_15455 [Pseudomonas alcaligenes]|uniref:Uncharacterized protein n=1 Tax=Aquipseudomonas alcaligenes TaxID=43263 RepID=A0ABR7S3Y6_AQUAC|nr:Ig-like domain-containing protein [Pseudomonas alcaligenes]MBC9251669.1 hypothetical protein [Pseudomonas alcaligenes]
MKADLSRSTDQPAKHYRSVRMQQGRVQLDADWNEQQDILNRRLESETRDSIGKSGAPIDLAGFGLAGNGQNIDISAGHLYLDGLLCDNPLACKLVGQPDLHKRITPILAAGASLLPLPPAVVVANNSELSNIRVYDANGVAQTPENGIYLGYLEAWLRHVTALEDGLIREVALGGPDSATRDQLVWQVKLLRVGAVGANLSCLSDIAAWNELSKPAEGKLAARAEPGVPPKDPCLLTPEAGYQRLENQLYRVEVHDDGVPSGPRRFKWSRDNGSILTRVTGWLDDPVANEIEVASIGRDAYLAITAGCWLEVFNDDHEETGRAGALVQVLKTEGNRVTLDLASATPALSDALFSRNPRVRRWDGVKNLEAVAANAGDNLGWVELEDGVEVRFLTGKLRVGDYWTIPARTATADLEWPEAGGKPLFVAPQGVLRAFTRLALLNCQNGIWTSLSDCRQLFPALTELTNLHYVGGDGQQAMPNPLAPQRVALPAPLQVAVYNGQFPVVGAQVRFSAPAGLLSNGTTSQTLVTDANGIASVVWFLAPGTQNQGCTAELLLAGAPVPGKFNEIHFSASLAVATAVAYDPKDCADMQAEGVNTVQKALDSLCRRNHEGGCCVTVGEEGTFPTLDQAVSELIDRGERDICLCLLPGEHQLADDLQADGKGEVSLLIHGAGPASRLNVKGQSIVFERFRGLLLRDFDLFGDEQSPLAVQLSRCQRLSLSHLGLGGLTTPGNSLLQIGACSLVELSRLMLVAHAPKIPGTGLGGGGSQLSQPGFALMLADAKGEISLSDSAISGRISLYGESASSEMLSASLIKRLGGVALEEEPGRLYLGNNRLGEIRMGDDLLAKLKAMGDSTAQGEIPGCFASLIANDNVLGPQSNQWLAVRVALSQNRLRPGLDNAGFVIAKEGKYLGNFCNGNCHLITAGHAIEQFGNGQLSIS